MTDDRLLASKWFNSGPEMLPEEFEPVLGQVKAIGWFHGQNIRLSDVLRFNRLLQ